MNYLCLNGKLIDSSQPVLMADNRSYRYGDGLFETMKISQGKIILEQFHFDRLFAGMRLLKFKTPASFTRKALKKSILSLVKKNKCEELARVRLSISRGQGSLYVNRPTFQWLIEAGPAEISSNKLNKEGLLIDIFPDLQKACDLFSNLKSANFLPYALAAMHATEKKVHDSLVCNSHSRIADSTIANIFLVKNRLVITPALTEGCVNGTMRRWLIQQLSSSNYELREGVVTRNDLEAFDEVFLTNAVYGIRWVSKFRDKVYSNTQTQKIYEDHVSPLFQ